MHELSTWYERMSFWHCRSLSVSFGLTVLKVYLHSVTTPSCFSDGAPRLPLLEQGASGTRRRSQRPPAVARALQANLGAAHPSTTSAPGRARQATSVSLAARLPTRCSACLDATPLREPVLAPIARQVGLFPASWRLSLVHVIPAFYRHAWPRAHRDAIGGSLLCLCSA